MDEDMETARFIDEGCPNDPVDTSDNTIMVCRFCGKPMELQQVARANECLFCWLDRLFK